MSTYRLDPDDELGRPTRPVLRALTPADRPPPVDWLWPQRLPLAALTLLIGDPGVGKSVLTADLAARVTLPLPWPDDPPAERPVLGPIPIGANPDPAAVDAAFPTIRGWLARQLPPSDVLFVAPEDTAALPGRLAAAGANVARIGLLDGVQRQPTDDPAPLRLPRHMDLLAQAVRAYDRPRLVVLDPLHLLLDDGAYCVPDTQARLLAALAELARQRCVSLLAVGHFGKHHARRALYRIRGSLSFVAAARSILLVSHDPDSADRRIVTQIKNAFGPTAPPLAFRIVDAPGAGAPIANGPKLEWESPSPADWRLKSGTLDLSSESFSVLSETCAWITDFLAAGPRPATEVLTAARAAGIPPRTLYRAKVLLNIASQKQSDAWVWSASQPPSLAGRG